MNDQSEQIANNNIGESITTQENVNTMPLPQPPARTEGGQPDNNNAMKYKTPEERQALCKAYCDHISKGLSDTCFPECDMETFKDYRNKFAVDFDSDAITTAQRKRQLFWETIGINGTLGIPHNYKTKTGIEKESKQFNAMSWKYNMSNRFGWKERQDMTTDDEKIETTVIYKPEKLPEGA